MKKPRVFMAGIYMNFRREFPTKEWWKWRKGTNKMKGLRHRFLPVLLASVLSRLNTRIYHAQQELFMPRGINFITYFSFTKCVTGFSQCL